MDDLQRPVVKVEAVISS